MLPINWLDIGTLVRVPSELPWYISTMGSLVVPLMSVPVIRIVTPPAAPPMFGAVHEYHTVRRPLL
jgi:hypothetical protein